jgi:hypothetical protein
MVAGFAPVWGGWHDETAIPPQPLRGYGDGFDHSRNGIGMMASPKIQQMSEKQSGPLENEANEIW